MPPKKLKESNETPSTSSSSSSSTVADHNHPETKLDQNFNQALGQISEKLKVVKIKENLQEKCDALAAVYQAEKPNISDTLSTSLDNHLVHLQQLREDMCGVAIYCFEECQKQVAKDRVKGKEFFLLYLQINALAKRHCVIALEWLAKIANCYSETVRAGFLFRQYELTVCGMDRYCENEENLAVIRLNMFGLIPKIDKFCRESLIALNQFDSENLSNPIQHFQNNFKSIIWQGFAMARLNLCHESGSISVPSISSTATAFQIYPPKAKRSRDEKTSQDKENNPDDLGASSASSSSRLEDQAEQTSASSSHTIIIYPTEDLPVTPPPSPTR